MNIAPEERFWSYVNKNGPIIRPELGPCWIWTGGLVDGYGKFSINGVTELAHRFSWKLAGHDLPDEALVCHECDNRPCIRPDHLFMGTDKTNVRDMINKGRNLNTKLINAKLNEQQVIEIRQKLYGLHAKSQTELAKIYGVDRRTISEIKLYHNWRHVMA